MEEQEDLQSAVLPFETTAHLPKDVTVEWKLTDPKHMMVHVYQNAKNQPNKQDKVYRGRTDMKEDLLRTGDLSLTLKNLSLHDSGVYTCTVYKSGKTLQQKVVTLSVKGQQSELQFYTNMVICDSTVALTSTYTEKCTLHFNWFPYKFKTSCSVFKKD